MARNPFRWIGDEIIEPLTDAVGLTDSDRGQREREQREQAQGIWDSIEEDAPSFEDLYQPYNEWYGATPYTTEWHDGVEIGSERDAQRRALEQMQGVAEGGLTPADRMAMQDAQQTAAAAEQSQRAAIQQQMQMRGVGGSGMDYAARLAAQQGAANRGRRDATQVANAAQQRALQAMQMSGQQANRMGDQRFSQQAQRSNALDRFNEANTQRRDEARRANIDRRAQAAQQVHDNRVQSASGRTGQLNYNSSVGDRQRAQRQAQQSQLIGAAGNVLSSYIQSQGEGDL